MYHKQHCNLQGKKIDVKRCGKLQDMEDTQGKDGQR